MLLSDPQTAQRLRLGGVTRYICALRLIAPQPAGPGPLPSRSLFLNRASVRRHIAASKNCRAADLGYPPILPLNHEHERRYSTSLLAVIYRRLLLPVCHLVAGVGLTRTLSGGGPAAPPPPAMTSPARASTWISR